MKKVAFLIALLFSYLLGGQNTLEYAQKFTISEGLAHNGVTSMLEDSRGLMWFGTFDGINKYDGYKFITYKNTVDKNILTSNRVRAISEDTKGNLWIGTNKGITIYNYVLEKFESLNAKSNYGSILKNTIVRKIIIEQERNLIIVATEGKGILVFDNNYKYLGRFFPEDNGVKEDITFYNAIKLNNETYLFSSSLGLYVFNISDYNFTKVLSEEVSFSEDLVKLNDDTIIVSLINGLAKLEFKTTSTGYKFQKTSAFLQDYRAKTLLIDDIGYLWVGTIKRGLIKIKSSEILKKPQNYDLFGFDDDLKVLRTSALVKTSKRSCWLSTFNEGVYRFNIIESPFMSYNVKMDYPYGLKANSVRHIASIDKDRIYLTSESDIALFNTKTEKFEPIKSKKLRGLSSSVGAIFIDSRKNSWLRLRGETNLFRIKNNNNEIEEIKLEISQLAGITIRSFAEDNFGNLWVSTNKDVYKINMDKFNNVLNVERINNNPYFSNNKLTFARFIYADPLHNFIWIGAGSKGLFRIENKNNVSIESLKIQQYKRDEKNSHSISSDFVSAIIRLPNEEFWVGTEGGGICKVVDSDTNPKFIPFTEKNGLSNNAVKNILYDEDYNLWVTTNIGLNKVNTKDFGIRKFKKTEGLPFEDFAYSSILLPNGTIMFSGLDGICYFDPSSVNQDEILPNVRFENLKILNKTIKPNDTINKRVLLEKELNQLEEIILKHNENIFSLDLISLHFLNPQNHNIKYRLLPNNSEWIEVPSSQNTIQYNELPHGEYELNVMASNSLNQWTVPKALKITIKPSIWNTNLAYSMYAIMALALIFLVVKVILKIQALNHKVEIEQLTIDNVKELNESKLRFFSNISHEIKTPLTLISGPIETLLQSLKSNGAANDRLNLMKRQIKKIEQLVDQVHDFRRADANMLKMNYSRFRFDTFIRELAEEFKYLARRNQKELEIVSNEASKIIVAADKDKLEKILNNLLNNAFKYTTEKDSIVISYSVDDKDLIITIEDTGKGIDKVDLPHVFERFYQSHDKRNLHKSGSGIGLAFSKKLVEMHYGFIDVESEIGKGSKFTIRLPIVKERLESEDIISEIKLPKEKEVNFDSKLIEKYIPSEIVVSGEFSKALIFYVEDNSEMRNYVSEVLSQYFKIETFSNGQECIDKMEDKWPDIVISDVQMPVLNGLDLCIRIKSDLKTSHIPVILLTALANIQDQVQGIRDGADAYIKKPFNVQRLVTNTEALLRNRKKLSERYKVGIPLTRDNNINDRNDNAFLDKLYSIIEENLGNQDFTLDELSKEMYLNRTHFYQKVKALTNQTPFEFLKMYRLKRAADFLVQRNMSVKQISIESGFKSRTHFFKVFKQRYNVSPGDYADEIEKKDK